MARAACSCMKPPKSIMAQVMRMSVRLFVVLTFLKPVASVSDSTQPALDLIQRNFGTAAVNAFELVIVDESVGCGSGGAKVSAPCFSAEADTTGGKVIVTATAMSELTYGIGYYARYNCGLSVGWTRGGGSHSLTNNTWPCHGTSFTPIVKKRVVKYTYQDNVCTHSYSYVWYDEAAWVHHIDWMALQGINVFLALTGQEEVQYKAFLEYGLNDQDIREFFNGPAYLTWSRGQSMQSVGSSSLPEGGNSGLPRSWMQSQWKLQKQILKQTRALGIIGVLPAFQGNMPPQIIDLFPKANISTTHHARPGEDNQTKGDCAWVASTDPLFGHVADSWMKILIEDFGTDHWYQCDGFFTGASPPWYDSASSPREASLASDESASSPWDGAPVVPDAAYTPVWKAAWEGMNRTDPDAKWLYQGWAIRGWNDAAGASRIKALYDVVPKGQWIPLDMDVAGIWRYFGNYSFFDAPFIWTTLHNMGGNDGMKGDMRMLQKIPTDALAAKSSIAGVGATPEGIDQNPPYYEYVFDSAWHATPQPLDDWFKTYSSRRYGNTDNTHAANAWAILSTTVYNSQAGGWHDDTGIEWNGVSGPPTASGIDVVQVYAAWTELVQAAATLDVSVYATLNYDIVNAGREVLAQLLTTFEHSLTEAVMATDKAVAMKWASVIMGVYADLDDLVGCDTGFLIGPWIEAARAWSNTSDASAGYYEWQARSQVSTWWPVAPSALNNSATFDKLPILDNYANKHWQGLIKDFYAKRVQCYINQVEVDIPAQKPNSSCTIATQPQDNTYLAGYPKSLNGGAPNPPATWPYNVQSLDAAKSWCCLHNDCGGVTHQNDRYEVRAGSSPIHNDGPMSYPREGANINQKNLTHCVVLAELTFTQGTSGGYLQEPTVTKTVTLSQALIAKYAKYIKTV